MENDVISKQNQSQNDNIKLAQQQQTASSSYCFDFKQLLYRFWMFFLKYLQFDQLLNHQQQQTIELFNESKQIYQRKYFDNFRQSYSQRSLYFGYDFEQVLQQHQRQIEDKQKNCWKQFKRFIFCQGSSFHEDMDELYATNYQSKNSLNQIQSKKSLFQLNKHQTQENILQIRDEYEYQHNVAKIIEVNQFQKNHNEKEQFNNNQFEKNHQEKKQKNNGNFEKNQNQRKSNNNWVQQNKYGKGNTSLNQLDTYNSRNVNKIDNQLQKYDAKNVYKFEKSNHEKGKNSDIRQNKSIFEIKDENIYQFETRTSKNEENYFEKNHTGKQDKNKIQILKNQFIKDDTNNNKFKQNQPEKEEKNSKELQKNQSTKQDKKNNNYSKKDEKTQKLQNINNIQQNNINNNNTKQQTNNTQQKSNIKQSIQHSTIQQIQQGQFKEDQTTNSPKAFEKKIRAKQQKKKKNKKMDMQGIEFQYNNIFEQKYVETWEDHLNNKNIHDQDQRHKNQLNKSLKQYNKQQVNILQLSNKDKLCFNDQQELQQVDIRRNTKSKQFNSSVPVQYPKTQKHKKQRIIVSQYTQQISEYILQDGQLFSTIQLKPLTQVVQKQKKRKPKRKQVQAIQQDSQIWQLN